MRPVIAITTLALAGAVPLGAQQAADVAVERAADAYARAKTIRASFEQTIVNPLTGRDLVTRGEFVRRQPNQIAIRFSEPKGDRIIADGKTVWVYLPSTNPGQVIRLPAGTAGTGTVDLAAQFVDRPRERYRIVDAGTGTVGGRSARIVRLTPKDRDATFTTATVWIDDRDGIIRRFELTEPSGLTRKVTLSTLELNGAVASSAFAFTPPKGVQIVDQLR